MKVNLKRGVAQSDRVSNSLIGACLMATADKCERRYACDARCVQYPVTINTVLGLDGRGRYQRVRDFVGDIATMASDFIVHARNAIGVQRLEPERAREVRHHWKYHYVHQLEERFFPALKSS